LQILPQLKNFFQNCKCTHYPHTRRHLSTKSDVLRSSPEILFGEKNSHPHRHQLISASTLKNNGCKIKNHFQKSNTFTIQYTFYHSCKELKEIYKKFKSKNLKTSLPAVGNFQTDLPLTIKNNFINSFRIGLCSIHQCSYCIDIFADTIVDSNWIATYITSKIRHILFCCLIKVKQNIVHKMC